MTNAEERGPADLGEYTMPDTEDRDPPTQHGETAIPAEDEESIGDKVKGAVSGVVDKAKGMFGGER